MGNTETNVEKYFTTHWRDLEVEYLCGVEDKCKNLKFSQNGMLGKDEKLIEVLEQDEKTLLELGITHQQIGDVLQNIEKASSGEWNLNWHNILDGRYQVRAIVWMGSQQSPFQHDNDKNYYGFRTGDRDIIVKRTSDNKEFQYGSLLAHMIKYNGFFEGNGDEKGRLGR